MNVALALLMLAWLVFGCVFMVADINDLCDEQMEQDRLDSLWSDEPPSAVVALEAVSTRKGTGSF